MPATLIQSQTFTSGDAYTDFVQGTLTTNVTAGNTLVITLSQSGVDNEVGTVVTNQTDTVVNVTTHDNTTDASTIKAYYITNAVGGSTQITYQTSPATFNLRVMTVMEFSGIVDTAPLDGTFATGVVDGYNIVHATGNLTTTTADVLLIGTVAGNNSATVFSSTAGGGWSGFSQGGSALYTKLATHYKSVASTGSYASSFDSTTYINSASMIFALKINTAPPVTNTTKFFQFF